MIKRHFEKGTSSFELVFIVLLALFVQSHSVQLNEQNRQMIRKAISSFVDKALSYPTVVIPPDPVIYDEWLPERERYTLLPYILFHPLIQMPHLFRDAPLLCPTCQKDGKTSTLTSTDNWRDGRNSRSASLPRLIYGMDSIVLLVSKVYQCPNGHSEIPANDPDIIKRIPNSYLPFLLMHKSGLTTKLLRFVEDLIDSGVSINAVETMIREAYKRHLSLREERFWIDCRLAMSFNKIEMTIDMACAFPTLEHYPSSAFITEIVVSHFKINEAFYRQYFSSLSARWISCDHTFKTAMNVGYFRRCDNKWIKQYRSLFCILNELGQVIQWQLTATEGFEEVRHMFMDLKGRFNREGIVLEGIFIDNCCKWRTMINSALPGIAVKLDLFHAVQRIVKKIPKKQKLSREFANDVGLIFRKPNDLGLNRKYNTPKPSDIIENFRKFEKKWEHPKYKNGTKILSKEIRTEIKKLKVHVEKGCLSDIPPSCSTSRNERLHKDMNKIIRSSRLGVELAYTRIFRMLYLHNKKKDVSAKTIYGTRAVVGKKQYESAINDKSGGEATQLESDAEVFGIRPKIQELESGSLQNDGQLTIDEFNYNVLMDIRASLQTWTQNLDEDNEGKQSESILCDILSQALGWWATALTLESLLGKRLLDKRKVPSVARARLNTSTLGVNKALGGESWDEQYAQRLHDMASTWGFSVVDIPKNGNCLFTAVALQLQQLFSNTEVLITIKVHLENLGIRGGVSLDEMAVLLRNLVVDEWIGPFIDDYLDFFPADSKLNYIKHAETYRVSGTFASELGDAMPLALANVLGMPLLILSLEHFTPFLDICPRAVKCDVFPIYLCHYPAGGGHYDALMQCVVDISNNSPESSDIVVIRNTEDHSKQDELLARPNLDIRSCRCGVNAKKKKNTTRKYSVRCPCMRSSAGSCSPSCRCSGSCGGSECRELPKQQEETTQRKQRKRGIQQLQQNSPKKAKLFMDEKKEKVARGSINIAEFYLLHAIINHLQSLKQSTLQVVFRFYDDISKMIEESSYLSVLPMKRWNKSTINKEIRKILKNDENIDSFAGI